MNWFERYGIPGLYFVGLMAGWVYAYYPQIIHWKDFDTLLGLIAALIAISLPIGYVISIIQQSVYLNWRRCLWGRQRLRGWLGVHGAALDSAVTNNQERDEPIIEARTLLLTATRKGYLNVSTHRYIRNWIARRADVCAINLSLVVDTFLAGIIAPLIRLLPGDDTSWKAIIILSIISVFVISVTLCSYRQLRRQVIEVIAGIYRTYRWHDF